MVTLLPMFPGAACQCSSANLLFSTQEVWVENIITGPSGAVDKALGAPGIIFTSRGSRNRRESQRFLSLKAFLLAYFLAVQCFLSPKFPLPFEFL